MTDLGERISDAQQAKMELAFTEAAFKAVRDGYMNNLQALAAKALSKDDMDGLVRVSLAIKIIDLVRSQILDVVNDGKLADADVARQAQLSRIPAVKRNILGI